MPSFPVKISSATLVKASATPALARISSPALSQLLVKATWEAQKNLPVISTQKGNIFQDRFDANLRWYTPVYVLAADQDALFGFAASQTGTDSSGNPFNKCRLTLGLKKVFPDDVTALKVANPGLQVREIPVTGLTASLSIMFKDADTGLDQHKIYSGAVTVAVNEGLQLTFDNILGGGVIILYENLVRDGAAQISISGTYEVWQQTGPVRIRPDPPIFVRGETPVHREMFLSRSNLHMARIDQPFKVFHGPRMSFPHAPDAGDQIQFQQGTATMSFGVMLGTTYAAHIYALKYTVTDGSGMRPIINVNDLKNYNVKQSEFISLKTLGDISQRYPSLSRLYLGVLSKTILVIPSRYAIVRSSQGVGAVCQALLDSASSSVSKCKFEFTFLLAPDVSPIDLLGLSQEVSAHPDLHGCTVKLPDFLKEGTSPKLLSAFQSSCQYSGTPDPHTFALSVEIKDEQINSPAIANANLLIKQLCSQQQPFLFATLSLKLDDYYDELVEANAVLNFRQTSGTDELTFTVDESSQTVIILNRSPFDLVLSRYALCTPNSISIFSTKQIVTSGNSISVPLPADHNALSVLVDCELAVEGPISKAEISKYMAFQTQDVQNTQYALGINASDVNFDGRGISHIDVEVRLLDLSDVTVPKFSLVKLRKVDGTTILVPLQNAISSLRATVLFTIHHSDSQHADVKFSLQHEFIDDPIFILHDADLPAAGDPTTGAEEERS